MTFEGEMNRRKFLVGGLATIATSVAMPDAVARERIRRPTDEGGLNAKIEDFQGLPGNVLVVAANNNETGNQYKLAVDALKERNNLRKPEAKFVIGGEKGIFTSFEGHVRDKSESDNGPIQKEKKKIFIVNADHPGFAELVKKLLEKQDNKPFSMIQFRGSQGDTPNHPHQDMENMLKKLKSVDEGILNRSIVFFGGCHGLRYLSTSTDKAPVIVVQDTGEASINSALLARLFDMLGSRKYRSFKELYVELAEGYSKNVGTGAVIIPGAPNYGEKLAEGKAAQKEFDSLRIK